MIRRPMVYITSIFASAIIISFFFQPIPALMPVFIFAFCFFKNTPYFLRHKFILILMVSYLGGIISFAWYQYDESTFVINEGDKVTSICRVLQVEHRETTSIAGNKEKYMQIKADAEVIDGKAMSGNRHVLLRYYLKNDYGGSDEDFIVPGDTIKVTGTYELPEGRRNPGCFDYALYLRSVGIKYMMTAEKIEIHMEKDRNSLRGRIYMLKEQFLKRLEREAGEETAGLMRAVMFGEKSCIDDEILEEFQKNGTAHVLAVSGLHIGIIYGFLSMLWRWKKGKLFFSLIIVFFLVYMVMASFSPSVVRAVIMVWIHVFASLTGRRYDMASAAFFTALIMLFSNPMQIFNVGFQMSFLAVLTLSLMLPLIKRLYAGVFLGSLAIQIGLAPYTVYIFNYISIVSVIVNVPIIYITGIIVPAGMCCMVSMVFFQPVFDIVSKVLFGLCSIMEKLNGMTSIEGITVFDVKSPDLWILAVYYLSLLVFVSEDGRLLFLRKKKKVIILLAVMVVITSMVFGAAAGNDFKDTDVVFVDVGQGDCIHLRTGRKGDYLVDGGGSISYNVAKKTLKPYLLKNDAGSIDGAFVTHLHTDHYKGIAELCREGMVEKLYVYEGYMVREDEILSDTGLEKRDIVYLHAGQIVDLGNGTSIEVLWPEPKTMKEYEEFAADEEDENSLSLIMKITVKGSSILATGDVDSECLDMLAEKYGEALDADILKVAHHGSKYSDSEAFAEASSPGYAVFQVGKNNFGHPDKGIVEKIRQQGIIIYRNDTDGAVAFEFKKDDEVLVRTVKENEGV